MKTQLEDESLKLSQNEKSYIVKKKETLTSSEEGRLNFWSPSPCSFLIPSDKPLTLSLCSSPVSAPALVSQLGKTTLLAGLVPLDLRVSWSSGTPAALPHSFYLAPLAQSSPQLSSCLVILPPSVTLVIRRWPCLRPLPSGSNPLIYSLRLFCILEQPHFPIIGLRGGVPLKTNLSPSDNLTGLVPSSHLSLDSF